MSKEITYTMYTLICDQEQLDSYIRLMRDHAGWTDETEKEIKRELIGKGYIDKKDRLILPFHVNVITARDINRETFMKNEGFPKWMLEHMFDFIDEGFTLYIEKEE